ncbi:MAG: tail fiber domain-containing protein, partial [Deltaproteobacteria bacterium]|nr:tail fiber domain-containing protein [Deltaproteobacteria bacterium]
GYLTDKAGAPVTRDAAVSVGLYKTYAGDDTDLVLEEDLGTISVKDGYFTIEAGKKSGIGGVLPAYAELYLEVRIDGKKMAPRAHIGTVPYSFVSSDVVGDIHPKTITVGTDQLVCKDNRVGIGHAAPTSKLHVQGEGEFNGAGTISSSGSTVTGVGTKFTTELHVGDYIFSEGQKRTVASITNDVTLTTGSVFNPPLTAISFTYHQPVARVTNSAGANIMTVNAVGKVGIGVENPEQLLMIKNPYADNAISIQNSTGGRLVDIGAWATDKGSVRLYDSGTESVRIAAQTDVFSYFNGGFVGIGTTTPEVPLTVQSSVYDQFIWRNGTYRLGQLGWVSAAGGTGYIILFAGGSAMVDIRADGTAIKPGGGSWTAPSDSRLKKNVVGLHGALDKLLRLRGVTFEWRGSDTTRILPGKQIGMIAQEVEPVFPEWVGIGRDGFKNITYRGFEALTVEAFREQQSQLEALRAQNERLEKKVEAVLAAQRAGAGGAGPVQANVATAVSVLVLALAVGVVIARRRRP